jgi:CRP-like cAMP-binding protein
MTGFEAPVVRQNWNRATERDWAEVLARLPLFSGIGRRRLRKLARQARFAEFAPGEHVVSTGDRGDAFYVILGGTAKALKPEARTLGPGDYFGEISLLDGKPRSATVVATEELHVMRLPRRTFRWLIAKNGDVALTLLTELGERLRRLEREAA